MAKRYLVSCLMLMALVMGASATSAQAAAAAAGSAGDPVPPPGVIAFGRWDDAIGDFELFTMAGDGSDEQPLLSGPHECPQWSPDGSTLAITAVSPAGQVVPAFVDADGSGYRELSVDPTLNLGCAAWSPDGTSLIYEAWDDTEPARAGIYTVRVADGNDLARLTKGRDIPGSYSPDGRSIVFTRAANDDSAQLLVMDADGLDPKHVVRGSVGLMPSFSPDGTMILADNGHGAIFTVDVESGQVTAVPLPADSNAYGARWSPDGEWIVLSIHMHREPNADIYLVRPDGTGLTQLTNTPDDQEEFADWIAS